MRAESTGLPRTSIDAHGALQFRFERARHGIRYVVQTAPTIGDWSDPEIYWDSHDPLATPPPVPVGTEQRIPIDTSSGPTGFFRLEVRETP